MFLHHFLAAKSSGSWRREKAFIWRKRLRRIYSENYPFDNLAIGIIGFRQIGLDRIGLLSATLDNKVKSLPTNFQRRKFSVRFPENYRVKSCWRQELDTTEAVVHFACLFTILKYALTQKS